jgi:hypothetical protein
MRPQPLLRFGRANDVPASSRHGGLLGSDALRRRPRRRAARGDRLLLQAGPGSRPTVPGRAEGGRWRRGGANASEPARDLLELWRTGRLQRLTGVPGQPLESPPDGQLSRLLGRPAPRQRRPQEPPGLLDAGTMPVIAPQGGSGDLACRPLRRRAGPERRALVRRRVLRPRGLRERVGSEDVRSSGQPLPERSSLSLPTPLARRTSA